MSTSNQHRLPYVLPRPSLKNPAIPKSYLNCSWTPGSASSSSSSSSSLSSPTSSFPNTPSYQIPPPPSPHVHFPPVSTLAKTYTAYSRTEYDRSPLTVAENECALPKRGCPGRTHYAFLPGRSESPELSTAPTRQSRTTQRTATPGPSRASSRCRMPETTSYYNPSIYRDDYGFPSPRDSPRSTPPSLVPDDGSSASSSSASFWGDDASSTTGDHDSNSNSNYQADAVALSQQLAGLNFLFPEYTTSSSNGGSQPGVYAPGHPPIPKSTKQQRQKVADESVYAIANALNGVYSGSDSTGSGLGILTRPNGGAVKKTKKKVKVVIADNDGCLGGF